MADITDWQALPTPSAGDLQTLAASRPQAYQPTADEAQQMAADLAANASKGGSAPAAVTDWQDVPASQMEAGAKRGALLLGGNFIKGLTQMFGAPGDLVATGARAAGAITGDNTDLDKYASYLTPFPTSTDINELPKKVGLTDRPDVQPQAGQTVLGVPERYAAAGARGAGATLPLLPLGPAAAAAPAIASGIAGGVGSQAGEDLLPDHPVLGSLLGGVVGGGGTGLVSNIAGRAANAVRGISNDMGKAYSSVGIDPRLAGDVSQSPLLRWMQTAAGSMPGGGKRIHEAIEAVNHDFGNSIENTAGMLGTSATPQQAGKTLQDQARTWLTGGPNPTVPLPNTMPAKQAAAWDPVNKVITPDTPVDLTNFRSALSDLNKDTTMLGMTGQALRPGQQAKTLLDALDKDFPNGGPASWQFTHLLKQQIGDMRGDPGLVPTVSKAALNRLYASLSEDMKKAAENAGVGPLYNAANAESTRLYNFADMLNSKVISSKNPAMETIAPEKAAMNILSTAKAGDTTIADLQQEMPEAVKELAAFKLRDMALANPGTQNAAGNSVSPGTFLTDWGKLSPEAKATLFPDKVMRERIDNLAFIAEGIKKTLATSNTSKTASHTVPLLAAFEGGKEGFHAGGVEGAIAGALAPTLAGKAASMVVVPPRVLGTNPALAFAMARRPDFGMRQGVQYGRIPPLLNLLSSQQPQQQPDLLAPK